MSRGGIGVGSASVILVFSVLCLTVFSLITYLVSGNDKALVDAEARLITGYYEADTLAERILAGIIGAGDIPEAMFGVGIEAGHDYETGAATASYLCPVSDSKALYVKLIAQDNSYRVLSWKMVDTDEWEFDGSLNVWTED